MSPIVFGWEPQLVEVMLDPNSLQPATCAVVAKGQLESWEVTVHIAFHPQAEGELLELYLDDAEQDKVSITGVLRTERRVGLLAKIHAHQSISLTVLAPDAPPARSYRSDSAVGLKQQDSRPAQPTKAAMNK